jgi:hypothetical protein
VAVAVVAHYNKLLPQFLLTTKVAGVALANTLNTLSTHHRLLTPIRSALAVRLVALEQAVRLVELAVVV